MELKPLVEWLKGLNRDDSKSEDEKIKVLTEKIDEHSAIAFIASGVKVEKLQNYFPFETENMKVNPTKSLGLYLKINENSTFTLKAHYYIGYWWVSEEEKIYVRIAPKKRNGKKVDFVKVL